MRLTENAIVKLNDIALTIHHNDFKRRINRLVDRLTGCRLIRRVWKVNDEQTYILEVKDV